MVGGGCNHSDWNIAGSSIGRVVLLERIRYTKCKREYQTLISPHWRTWTTFHSIACYTCSTFLPRRNSKGIPKWVLILINLSWHHKASLWSPRPGLLYQEVSLCSGFICGRLVGILSFFARFDWGGFPTSGGRPSIVHRRPLIGIPYLCQAWL